MGNKKSLPLMNVNWRRYFDLSNPTIVKYLSKYGIRFIEQTFFKINRAHAVKKPYIILIKFNGNDDIVSILYQNEYEEALNHLMNLCIKIEYYELCAEIQKQLISLDKRKRRKITKSKIKVG
jgi:hypothetical protein